MSINRLDILPPVVGKISLGVRKATSSGGERPSNLDYFVLDHIDEKYKSRFIEVYKDKPEELDIIFLSDDLDQVIPTWYCWFSSGIRNDRGEMMGGKLRCKGDGPDRAGNPGTALWVDKKDPVTRMVPVRPCMAEKCPDWFSPTGKQQCSQTMQVFCLIPLVTMDGVFSISTRSWHSIKSFHSNLKWVKDMNNGTIRYIPFKVYREEEAIPFTDHNGSQKVSKHAIMKLMRNHDFEQKHGGTVMARIKESFKYNVLMPKAEDAMELAASTVGMIEEGSHSAPPVVTSEALVKDPEVSELFDQLEVVSNKAFSDKARLLAIRKLEGAEDLKASVIETLMQKISDARPVQQEPVSQDVTAHTEVSPSV